jgi:hypothetical protein
VVVVRRIGMIKKKNPSDYFRGEWKIEKKTYRNPNKGYIPSYKRPGFDESKVIKLPRN